jgi:tetratricopeptide (TPR) repeat protein
MKNKPSKRLAALNYIIFALALVGYLLFPVVVSKHHEYAAKFVGVEKVHLPLYAQIYLSTPLWVYFVVSYLTLTILIIKEKLIRKLAGKIGLNVIALIAILIIIRGYMISLMIALPQVQTFRRSTADESAKYYYNSGLNEYERGNHEEAIDDFTGAIEKNSKFAGAYYNRGIAKDKTGDFEGALKDLLKAIELDPAFKSQAESVINDVKGKLENKPAK